MYTRIRIFGHPVHPMLVGFPVAFYTATLVGFIVFAANHAPFWFKLAMAANIAGVGMAVLAALPGFIDWALGIPRGSRAKTIGLRHMLLNVAALGLFVASLAPYVHHLTGGHIRHLSPTIGVVLTGLGVLCTIAAGFHGWMLVQDHHVGVRPMSD